MANTPPLLFETPRLLLRAALHGHAAALFEKYTGRLEAARYLQRVIHPSQIRTETVLDAWGEANWLRTDRFVWSIFYRPEERPIGLFLMFIEGTSAEIHYGLGPAYLGQGLATEAGVAVINWIEGQSGLKEVATSCAAEHAASLRVLEKIGLHQMRLLPGDLLLASTGAKVDAWLYSWKRF